MAKFEKVLQEKKASLEEIEKKITHGVCSICTPTKKRDSWTTTAGDVTCMVTVYEKMVKRRWDEKAGEWKKEPHYSLSVTLVDTGKEVRLCAIATGGSQELYFNPDAVGEGELMEALKTTLEMWDSIIF